MWTKSNLLFDIHTIPKNNTSQFTEHLLTAYYAQDIVPATGNFIFVLKSISLPWSVHILAAWTLLRLPLDSRLRTTAPTKRKLLRGMQNFSLAIKIFALRACQYLEGLKVFSSLEQHIFLWNLPSRILREKWTLRLRTYLKAHLLLSILGALISLWWGS